MIHTHRGQRPWVVIVEPDAEASLLVVVTVLGFPPRSEAWQHQLPAFSAFACFVKITTRIGSPHVTLAIGTRIGPYEIRSALGAGGMGEVYRAQDTRLGRDVAIKVLPTAFTADPDRVARFEREARALAALNHPNIATIHGSRTAAALALSSWSSCPG